MRDGGSQPPQGEGTLPGQATVGEGNQLQPRCRLSSVLPKPCGLSAAVPPRRPPQPLTPPVAPRPSPSVPKRPGPPHPAQTLPHGSLGHPVLRRGGGAAPEAAGRPPGAGSPSRPDGHRRLGGRGSRQGVYCAGKAEQSRYIHTWRADRCRPGPRALCCAAGSQRPAGASPSAPALTVCPAVAVRRAWPRHPTQSAVHSSLPGRARAPSGGGPVLPGLWRGLHPGRPLWPLWTRWGLSHPPRPPPDLPWEAQPWAQRRATERRGRPTAGATSAAGAKPHTTGQRSPPGRGLSPPPR